MGMGMSMGMGMVMGMGTGMGMGMGRVMGMGMGTWRRRNGELPSDAASHVNSTPLCLLTSRPVPFSTTTSFLGMAASFWRDG